MKKSKYNNLVEVNKKKYIFNSLYGSIIEFADNEIDLLNENCYQDFDKEYQLILEDNGIFIKDIIDEREIIYENLKKKINSSKQVNFNIVTTLECNFACPYCHERNLKGKMNKRTYENLKTFIKKESKKRKSISITFYGGEPLLCKDDIISFLTALKKGIKSYDNILLHMITNGYLLDVNTVNEFKKLNLNSYQVTVDGNKELHNKYRPHKLKDNSFQVVMNNLSNISHLCNLSVRINLSKENVESVFNELLPQLNSILDDNSSVIYFGYLRDYYNEMCESILNLKEFSSYQNLLRDFFKNKSSKLKAKHDQILNRKFTYKPGYCGADTKSYFVVLPNGQITNCNANLQDKKEIEENIVGILTDNGLEEDSIAYDKWFSNHSIFNLDNECQECPLLPICFGGCPKFRKSKIKNCEMIKDNLGHYIEYVLEKKNEQK